MNNIYKIFNIDSGFKLVNNRYKKDQELLPLSLSDLYDIWVNLNQTAPMCVLDILMIEKNHRGTGKGSEIIQEKYIKENIDSLLIVPASPIHSTDETKNSSDSRDLMRRLIRFYHKNGFKEIPIRLISPGQNIRLFYYPGNNAGKIFDSYVTKWGIFNDHIKEVY